jgi:hypothetical protein
MHRSPLRAREKLGLEQLFEIQHRRLAYAHMAVLVACADTARSGLRNHTEEMCIRDTSQQPEVPALQSLAHVLADHLNLVGLDFVDDNSLQSEGGKAVTGMQ